MFKAAVPWLEKKEDQILIREDVAFKHHKADKDDQLDQTGSINWTESVL